jgi:hypothetical protein
MKRGRPLIPEDLGGARAFDHDSSIATDLEGRVLMFVGIPACRSAGISRQT